MQVMGTLDGREPDKLELREHLVSVCVSERERDRYTEGERKKERGREGGRESENTLVRLKLCGRLCMKLSSECTHIQYVCMCVVYRCHHL